MEPNAARFAMFSQTRAGTETNRSRSKVPTIYSRTTCTLAMQSTQAAQGMAHQQGQRQQQQQVEGAVSHRRRRRQVSQQPWTSSKTTAVLLSLLLAGCQGEPARWWLVTRPSLCCFTPLHVVCVRRSMILSPGLATLTCRGSTVWTELFHPHLRARDTRSGWSQRGEQLLNVSIPICFIGLSGPLTQQ